MSVQVEHEHWFVDHEDPRWLICDCGQYAVRARNIAGDRIVRLIDPPKPAFPAPQPVSLTTTDLTSTDITGAEVECPLQAGLAQPA
jgi:hypothetical protein